MKTAIIATILIVVVAVGLVLVVPVALAGGINQKVTKITLTEYINSTANPTAKLSANITSSTTTPTAYEYYFLMRNGGTVSTTNNQVNSTAGNTNATLSWSLTNPSGKIVNTGNYTFSSGLGNRTHTIIFSRDQGVQNSGTYSLNILISGKAVATGKSTLFVAADARYTFNVP